MSNLPFKLGTSKLGVSNAIEPKDMYVPAEPPRNWPVHRVVRHWPGSVRITTSFRAFPGRRGVVVSQQIQVGDS